MDVACSSYPWLQQLEASAGVIQEELKAALRMGKRLEETGNNVWAGPVTPDADGYGPEWKTLVLQVEYIACRRVGVGPLHGCSPLLFRSAFNLCVVGAGWLV